MLSGCYKKGVELIDQCEEQFESTFRIERLCFSPLSRRSRLLLLHPSRFPPLRRPLCATPHLLRDHPRHRHHRRECKAGASAVRDGGVGRGESRAGPAQPGAQRALASAAVQRVVFTLLQRQGGRRARLRRAAAAAGPQLPRQVSVDERAAGGAREDAGSHRAEEVYPAGIAAAEREGGFGDRLRRRFSSNSASATRRWRRVTR